MAIEQAAVAHRDSDPPWYRRYSKRIWSSTVIIIDKGSLDHSNLNLPLRDYEQLANLILAKRTVFAIARFGIELRHYFSEVPCSGFDD